MAHGYAAGLNAVARHANDARARQVIAAAPLFRGWEAVAGHASWGALLSLLPLVPILRRAMKIRRQRAA